MLNSSACAQYGRRLKVHGGVFFGPTKVTSRAAGASSAGAAAEDVRVPCGWIWLPDAEIDGNLKFTNAPLNGAYAVNGVSYSLYGERLNVHGDVLFDSVSSPNAAVWPRSAEINGKLPDAS